MDLEKHRAGVPRSGPTRFTGHGDETASDRASSHRRSGLVISREPGLRYDAGFAEAVLMS